MNRTSMVTIAVAILLSSGLVCMLDGADGAGPNVAEVNGVLYDDLSEAVDAADGSTVRLIADVDITSTGLTISKNVTLDLNGHKMKAANTEAGNLHVDAGSLTLKDGTDLNKNGNGSGMLYSETKYVGAQTGFGLISVDGGNFTMDSGKIYTVLANASNDGTFGITLGDSGTITINGGAIEAGWYAISGNGNDSNSNNYITINGGTLISATDYAIYHPHSGTLVINGGTVFGAAGAVAINRGSLTINGGTITSTGTGDTGNWGDGTGGLNHAAIHLNARYGDVDLTIRGGTFLASGSAVILDQGASHNVVKSIIGGEFSSDTGITPDAGYTIKQVDGNYVVMKEYNPATGSTVSSDTGNLAISGEMNNSLINAELNVKGQSTTVSVDIQGTATDLLVDVKPVSTPSLTAKDVFDINIQVLNNSSSVSYNARITVPVDVPAKMVPYVTSYNSDGQMIESHKVLTYGDGYVTFETNHTTLFAITFEAADGPIIVDDDPPYIPSKPASDDDLTTYIAVAAAAAVVAVLAVLIMAMNKGKF